MKHMLVAPIAALFLLTSGSTAPASEAIVLIRPAAKIAAGLEIRLGDSDVQSEQTKIKVAGERRGTYCPRPRGR
jgi:hypothetical protein